MTAAALPRHPVTTERLHPVLRVASAPTTASLERIDDTASDGPGPATRAIDGRPRRFFDYVARGVPYGPDDGTIAPWACVASLPFAPDIVRPTVRHFFDLS
ncbi:MAG: glucoamylase family protein [Vicinamibacterales bacterium]